MDAAALDRLLSSLLTTWENEVVEFKRGGSGFSTDDIGKYFSALANEANLRGVEQGWLVLGVDDKTRQVVGSDYRPDADRLDSLKHQIAQTVEPKMTFRALHVLAHAGGRVVLMEVPAAPRGIPISFKGHYYARAGESLVPLGLSKLDEIRQQTLLDDWTAVVVPGATLAHLDPEALAHTRSLFVRKYANRFAEGEVAQWPDATLLERARLTREGQLTRAALLLLGKAEAAHLLTPHPAQLTWKLEGPERAYQHFGPPWLLSTTQLFRQIRNIPLRILPDDTLLPVEVAKYDQKIVLEALHNCIAHQDYRRLGRVVVTELPDRLLFENEGGFFEGQPEDFIPGLRTPRRYRNAFLAQAMVKLNMIDTMGYGIYQMHLGQARRFLPLPDYDLQTPDTVRLTLYGNVVDPAYSRLLMQQTQLPFEDILALDRVQKHLPISPAMLAHLRRKGLVEGRQPKLHVSAFVAEATGDKASYIRNRAQDDAFYMQMILDYIAQFGAATRQELDELLLPKFSVILNEDQKRAKVSNLLTRLRTIGIIHNVGSRSHPVWHRIGEPLE
jgi:ATP-dependent DNA helicase RecG